MHSAYRKRFKRCDTPKYGTLNKGFTESEIQEFFKAIKNDKFRLLFKYMAYLGLRIGEVCALHLNNIDFEKRELVLKSEKSNKIDALIIPIELFKETVEFVKSHGKEIENVSGFIFFKDNDNNYNGLKHVEQNYARKVFREAVIYSNLDTTYGESDEAIYHRKTRTLHRLTTHSLRHYAITRFAKSSNGNVVLSSRFARHSDPTTTMRYIAKDNEQLYRAIESTFSIDQVKKLKGRIRAESRVG